MFPGISGSNQGPDPCSALLHPTEPGVQPALPWTLDTVWLTAQFAQLHNCATQPPPKVERGQHRAHTCHCILHTHKLHKVSVHGKTVPENLQELTHYGAGLGPGRKLGQKAIRNL